MRHIRCTRRALVAIALAAAPVARAETVLFSETFDLATSANRFDLFAIDYDTTTTPAVSPANDLTGQDVRALFSYDYSGFTFHRDTIDNDGNPRTDYLPIPLAPNSAAGSAPRGLLMDANNVAQGTAIVNAYPKLAQYTNGQLPSGNVSFSYDVWMNYNGDPGLAFEGGAGSTEFMVSGIHQQGNGIGGLVVSAPNAANTRTGYAFSVDGERGNGGDYRTYQNNTRISGPVANLSRLDAGYVAVDQIQSTGLFRAADNGENTFYGGGKNGAQEPPGSGLFPFVKVDGGGNVTPGFETSGSIGKQWVTMEVSYVDNIVYHFINGNLIAARTDFTTNAGHALVGYGDVIFSTANGGTQSTAESAGKDVSSPTGPKDVDASFAVYDNLLLKTVDVARPTWAKTSGGTWSDPAAWQNGVPDSNTSHAVFSATGGPQAVTVDGGKTVRAMTFDSPGSYTLSGSPITFNSITTGILSTFVVNQGNHVVNNDVTINRHLLANVAAGSSLTLNGNLTTGPNLTAISSAAITLSVPLGFNKTGAGTLTVNNLRGGFLSLSAGTLSIKPNGTATGVSVLSSVSSAAATPFSITNPLTVAASAKLDVNDNAVVVDVASAGAATTMLNTVRNLVTSAAGVDGLWAGNGITSSVARARATHAVPGPLTAVGFSLSSTYITRTGSGAFIGQTVDDSAVLIRHTFVGDANLTGTVNDADVDILVANYGTATGKVWSDADFNFDGLVNDRDIDLLAAVLGYDVPGISVTPASLARLTALRGTAAVPEPAALGTLAFAGAAALARRRRRQ